MNCVWDPKKNSRNIVRHGIAFEDAVRMFEGPTLEQVDDRFDYGEVRICAVGVVEGIEVRVICTDLAQGVRRIISAWRSERHEREAYWKNIG